MRLDKFLKVSRLIKRRSVANQACGGERVLLNGKAAKPGAQVKIGDRLEVHFGQRIITYEILQVQESVRKEAAGDMYREIHIQERESE